LTKKNIAEFNRENQRGQAMDLSSKNRRTQQFLNPKRRRSSDSPDSADGTLSSSGLDVADQLLSVITRAYQASIKRRQPEKRGQQSISEAQHAAGAKKKPTKAQGQLQAKYRSLVKLKSYRQEPLDSDKPKPARGKTLEPPR